MQATLAEYLSMTNPEVVNLIPQASQGDHKAYAKGYTKRVYISGGHEDGSFLIMPETDYDDRFKAWALDWEMWVWVSGWDCLIEDEEA